MSDLKIHVAVKAADEIWLDLKLGTGGEITSASLKGVGGPELIALLSEWRCKFRGLLSAVPLPTGNSGAALLLREAILTARGEWRPPYEEEELCHCRGVPAAVVHDAIIAGAHQPETVSRWTSASTSCGTCRRDVKALLAYYLESAAEQKAS